MRVRLWRFLKDDGNRAILGLAGGGVAAVVVAGWAVFTYFDAKGGDATLSVTVTASGGSVAVGGDVTAPVTVNTPPEQLAPLIKAATDPLTTLTAQQQATIGDLQRQLGVGEGAVRAFFRILGEEAVPRERWTEKLAEIAERFKRLQQDLAAASGDTPEIARLKQDARAALEAGDLQRADDLLQQVLAKEDQAAAEQQRAFEQRRLQAAATAAQRGEIAMTRLRYRDAAGHFAGAAARVPPDDAAERFRYLDAEAKALYRQGDEFGDNEALQEAIERDRALLSLRPRDEAPLDWAMTQNNLGNALFRLGEREGGTARLQDAVVAFRAALQEYTRERVPLQWAATQNNLGNALSTLGARESGTARLEDAVAAYRAALQEYTRARVPLQWATTQNNLGTALQTLGERESGTALLEDAVTAYRAALQERTRERLPLQWAVTQNNLGAALQTLGERESDTARLEDAVVAYRAALQERTRERVPLQWATTQNNLGAALWTLALRTDDVAMLQEARAAVDGAFDVYMQAGQEHHRSYFEERLQAIDRDIATLSAPHAQRADP